MEWCSLKIYEGWTLNRNTQKLKVEFFFMGEENFKTTPNNCIFLKFISILLIHADGNKIFHLQFVYLVRQSSEMRGREKVLSPFLTQQIYTLNGTNRSTCECLMYRKIDNNFH